MMRFPSLSVFASLALSLAFLGSSTVQAAPRKGQLPPPPQSSSAAAERSSDRHEEVEQTFSVGGNVILPNPVGDGNLIFHEGIGGVGHVWLNNLFDERALAIHTSVGYQTFGVINLSKFSLNQLTFLAGLEISAPKGGFFVRPFISGDIGTAFDQLSTAGSDVTNNANFAFVAQARPGVALQIVDNISIDVAMPFTGYFSQNQLYLLSVEAGLRVEL